MSTHPLAVATGDDTEDAADVLGLAALALARRFSAGATLWCIAPQWPEHGRHVAVEFVHPVVMGKRALPALHVEAGDPESTLRLLARPGDVLLALGSADEPRTAACLRRAEAWGLTRMWLGFGPRPPAGYADYVIWVDGEASELAPRSGELVLRYHLLWELTHVVLEHPGLTVVGLDPECAATGCITCSDQACVGEVRTPGDGGRAEVVVGGYLQTVDVSLVDPVAPGDLVLVHAGVAVTAIELRR